MIEFFRDVLSGPVYIVVAILAVIFIMAIIGFLMERKKLEKEEKERIAIISNSNEVPPIEPVTVETESQTPIMTNEQVLNTTEEFQILNEQIQVEDTQQPIEEVSVSNLNNDANFYQEVKTPVIIFEDPDEKKE